MPNSTFDPSAVLVDPDQLRQLKSNGLGGIQPPAQIASVLAPDPSSAEPSYAMPALNESDFTGGKKPLVKQDDVNVTASAPSPSRPSDSGVQPPDIFARASVTDDADKIREITAGIQEPQYDAQGKLVAFRNNAPSESGVEAAPQLHRGNRFLNLVGQVFGISGPQPQPGQPYRGPVGFAQKVGNAMNRVSSLGDALSFVGASPAQLEAANARLMQRRQLPIEQAKVAADIGLRNAQLQETAAYREGLLRNDAAKLQQGYDLAAEKYGPNSPQAQRVAEYIRQNGHKFDLSTGQIVPMSAEEIANDPMLSSKLGHTEAMNDYLKARAEFEKAQGPIQLQKLKQAEQRLQLQAQMVNIAGAHQQTYAQSVANRNSQFYAGLGTRELQQRIANNQRQKQFLLQAKQKPSLLAEFEGSMSPDDIDSAIQELDADSAGAYAQLQQVSPAAPSSPAQGRSGSARVNNFLRKHGVSQ